MFCSKCGKENLQNAKMCTSCGADMTMTVAAAAAVPKNNKSVVVVVIAVVSVFMLMFLAIFAAILFPVFARAREMAKKSTCQSNLKEISTAVMMYSTDYGVLPSSKLYNGSKKWNASDFTAFAKSSASGNTVQNLLVKYIRTPDVFRCPSDPNSGNGSPISYYWKAAVDVAWYKGYKSQNDFEYPYQQVLLYEHNDWHYGGRNRGLTDGVTINVAYLDGHIATKRVQNSGYTIEENPPEPLPRSGVGEPSWFNSSDNPNIVPGKALSDAKHCFDALN